MDNRIIALQGVNNFRDFGGYASKYGGTVKAGRLYRSGHYAEAKPQDVQQVQDLGIKLQVDLRRPDERERQPGKWSAPNTITHDGGRETDAPHTRFLQRVEASAEKAAGWMNDYYAAAPFKPHHQAMFSDWFTHLASLGDGQAGLVNCAAGKDRTGILCALTHHILGVSEDDIRADYNLTNTAARVDERLPEAAAYFNDLLEKDYDPEVYRPFMGVEIRFLETAFNAIESEAGGVDAYLTQTLGVTEAMQVKLRQQLLV